MNDNIVVRILFIFVSKVHVFIIITLNLSKIFVITNLGTINYNL